MKCSETLPNIVLGLTGWIGGVRGKTFVGSSLPRNSAFGPETQVLHDFLWQGFAKCSETLPNIVLGLTG